MIEDRNTIKRLVFEKSATFAPYIGTNISLKIFIILIDYKLIYFYKSNLNFKKWYLMLINICKEL